MQFNALKLAENCYCYHHFLEPNIFLGQLPEAVTCLRIHTSPCGELRRSETSGATDGEDIQKAMM